MWSLISAEVMAKLTKYWPYLAAALLAVLFLTMTYCSGRSAGRDGEIADQQERTIELQNEVGAANDTAADQRVQDVVRSEQQRRELDDALKATGDPDRARAIRGCIILQQQGRDTSNIAACR